MPRYVPTNATYLKQALDSLTDDITRHWSEYPCLLWPRGKSRAGYGLIRGGKDGIYAHRSAYESVHGQLADGLMACHHCDTPACFRPIHLFSGTQGDNMTDCSQKGRAKGRFSSMTHCLKGHVFDSQNTGTWGGKRFCKECARVKQRLFWRKKHAA